MNWHTKLVNHKGEDRIAVYFDYSAELTARIKALTGARWSQQMKAWHLPDTVTYRERFKIPTSSENVLATETSVQIGEFSQWLKSKRYSHNTHKTYTEALKSFLTFFSDKPIAEITNQDVVVYNNEFILKNKLSASYQNQIINAIKLYFGTLQKKRLEINELERPIREKKLPNVLSKEEIKLILSAPSNLKHKAMLSLIYSCGLRRSELLALKPTDINSKRGIILVRQAKGKKDRIVPLSPKVLELLREYYVAFKPISWLFEGIAGGPYDERSLSNVLKQALAKTKIKKPVSLHWLRHSYATHLLESGTDLRHIQEILGHNSSRTTELYTHVSTKSIRNVKSPFDDL
jgi:integrase/recombinase XerD